MTKYTSSFKNPSKVTQTICSTSSPLRSPSDCKDLYTPTPHSDPSTSPQSAHPSVSLKGSYHPVTQFPPAARRWVARAGNTSNAARERSRVRTLRAAFMDLQKTLPAVPRDTKLSKLDVLLLASAYIAQLSATLASPEDISHLSLHKKPKTTEDQNLQHKPKQSSSKTISLVKQHHHHHHNTWDTTTPTPLQPTEDQCHCRSRGYLVMGGDRNMATVREGDGEPRARFCSDNRQDKNKDYGPRLHTHGYFHPVKKWPMRSRLYAGLMASASGIKMKKSTSNMSME
ncbi:hypothetical protein ACOMHN_003083 [Nucella lapillus]